MKRKKNINFSNFDKKMLKKIKLNNFLEKDVFFDYSKVIVNKPWGFEFILFQDKTVALWLLYLKKNYKTSLHCHLKKKTILFVVKGSILFKTLNYSKTYKEGEYIKIDKKVFHQTKSISQSGSIILELETPVNKKDLVRLSDEYGRKGLGYETSFKNVKNINKLKKNLISKKIVIAKNINKNFFKNTKLFSSLLILNNGSTKNNKQYRLGHIISGKNINEIDSKKIGKESVFLLVNKKYSIENYKIKKILKFLK